MDEKEVKKRKRTRGSGEGTISQRQDGRWVGTITLGFDTFTCKQIKKSVVRKTRTEVATELQKMLAEKKKGKIVKNNKMTLENLCKMWLENKKIALKKTIFTSYKTTVDAYIIRNIGKIEIQKLTAEIIQKNLMNQLFQYHH